MAPLPGVRLGLYASQTATAPADPIWGECTADTQGDCTFVVPDTAAGGSNAGRRFWVRQLPGGEAPGWFSNPVLRTGPGSGSGSITQPYTFQTPALVGGRSYASTATGADGFMLSSTYGSNYTASGGIWQSARVDPAPAAGCGMDAAVVLDLSASVGSALPQLKAATDTLVDSLTGTPSRLALFSFDQASPSTSVSANHPELHPVSTQAGADAFKQLYSGWTLGKGTNWDQGLWAVARASQRYQAVIVITDGNPTRFADNAQGDGSNTHFRDAENGIFSANAVKAKGSRVIALGVGKGVAGVSGLNLRAISGPTAYDGTNLTSADYLQTADFQSAAEELHNLALARCQGSISVVKQIVPATTSGEDVTGAANAGEGWAFHASTDTSGVDGLPATETTTDDGTGSVAFQPSFTGTTTGQFTIREAQHAGYELVTPGGRHATCTDLDTGRPVDATNTGTADSPGFALTLSSKDAVSCVLYNRPVEPADVAVTKTWRIDGTDYEEGSQPAGFTARLTLTGPASAAATAQPWGVARRGYRIGQHTTIAEATRLAEGCTLDSARLTTLDGRDTDLPLPHSAELTGHHLTARVTNTVTCRTGPTPTPPATHAPPGTPGEHGPHGELPRTGGIDLRPWLTGAVASLTLGLGVLAAVIPRRRRH